MMRVWGHILTGVAAVTAGGIVVSACAHNDSEVFVRDVLAPQVVALGTPCNFTNDPTQASLPFGVLDAYFRGDYIAELLVGNQTVAQGNPSTPRTETSYVRITNAIVRVTLEGGRQLSSFTASTSGLIAPAVGTSPSYAPIGVPIVDTTALNDPAVAGALAGFGGVRLVTYVRVLGQTLGGQSVESSEFAFPINVCMGCLIGCGSTTSNTAQSSTGSCNGQDFGTAVDPTTCAGNSVCRSVCRLPDPDAGSALPDAGSPMDASSTPDSAVGD